MSSLSNIVLTTALAFSAMVAAGPVPSAAVSSTTLVTCTTTATGSQPTSSVPGRPPTYLDRVKACVNPTWPPASANYELTHKPIDQLKQIFPNYYRVYANEGDRFDNSYDSLLLQSYEFESQVETILEFKNIPANAKKCTLHAEVGNMNERIFVAHKREPVAHHGESQLVNVEILKGLPKEGKVTYNAVQQLRGPRVGSIDFSGWDDSEVTERVFSSYGVPCQSELFIKLSYYQRCNEKTLFIQQTQKTGFKLRYELDE
jgi:hypothetical protein